MIRFEMMKLLLVAIHIAFIVMTLKHQNVVW